MGGYNQFSDGLYTLATKYCENLRDIKDVSISLNYQIKGYHFRLPARDKIALATLSSIPPADPCHHGPSSSRCSTVNDRPVVQARIRRI